MNKYLKEYLQRGFAFSGLGPIVLGIVYAVLEATVDGFSLGGVEVLVAILSTYVIAFVQAGGTVFNQIEDWSVPKSLLCHLGSIYLAYLAAYLVNTWIPFDWSVILIFTAIFLVTYFVVWVAVYLTVRAVTKRMNERVARG